MPIPVESFFLPSDRHGTLQGQIQQMVAEAILAGRIKPGEKLPSSRKLAAHLGVSRITVTLAYTDLVASEYLSSRGRSGFFVSENAPEPMPEQRRTNDNSAVDWSQSLARKFDSSAMPDRPEDWSRYSFPFIYGQADPALFDHANWRLCAIQALGQRDFTALTNDAYDRDDPELVEFILRHSLPRRGIAARPEEVLVTLGAQNALWLTSQVLLDHTRRAVIENPGYPTMRDILSPLGCAVEAAPVDQFGLQVGALPSKADAVFVTPSHHCPTSATMTADRRQALLDWAERTQAIIVEDDYEFEMSFLSPASPALKSHDTKGRVIYVGSFSKALFPGLRLGYLVGPEPFIRAARALRSNVLRHPPGHVQRTAAYFLRMGHYDAQIKRMSRVLANRRIVMEDAIKAYGLTIVGSEGFGGSSFWMAAPQGTDMAFVANRLQTQGVLIEPGKRFFTGPQRPTHFYRLAYSSIPAERIPEGIERIANTLKA